MNKTYSENIKKLEKIREYSLSQIEVLEMITISIDEYDQLKQDSLLLDKLIAGGIENWDGYKQAINFN